jgi:hypothetical protein
MTRAADAKSADEVWALPYPKCRLIRSGGERRR